MPSFSELREAAALPTLSQTALSGAGRFLLVLFSALSLSSSSSSSSWAFRPEQLLGDLDPEGTSSSLSSREGEMSPFDPPAETSIGPSLPPGEKSKALANAAHASVGTSTAKVPNTQNGKLACAWAANDISTKALGKPLGTGGAKLSTASLNRSLANNPEFARVPLSEVRPGDVVISPTVGKKVGHVGIMGHNGRVIENSSSRQQIREGRTISQWQAEYAGRRQLSTYIYRPI
jgi:hypothetical protein